ncbi:MAG: Mur ligase family protein [Candidatus Peregrinibacteria bacterium]|nr:Mur ligase family protein [Candidatus Peregrinibacteria bacterium]
MNFEKAKEFLQSFVSYEGVAKIPYSDKTFDLQKVKDFLHLYGVEYENLKCIHVAGSKGKGTTCAFIANYLWKDGYKVGLYTSPHIFEVTERIWMNGKDIEKVKFAKMVEGLKKFIEKTECPKLTYFEILTVLALKYFVDEKVDYAVFEVGLGGRLDATNVVKPILSILTTVELEHTDVLGDTIEKILNEKLGIVKDGVPVLIGYQSKATMKIIGKKLKGRKDVYSVNDFEVKFSGKDFSDEARFKNAHVAFAALKLFSKKFPAEKKFLKIADGVKLPGRFDARKSSKGTVVFDMAHTENSIDNLVNGLKEKFPKKNFVFLFALMKGKNVEAILKKISSIAEKIVFTSAHEVRGIQPEELKSIAEKVGAKCELEVIGDCMKAFDILTKKNQLLVVTGSHFLVGKLLKKKL